MKWSLASLRTSRRVDTGSHSGGVPVQVFGAGGTWGVPALFSVAVALFGVWCQGFIFGQDNNVFHIPFVLRWNQLPQFSADAFYRSLDQYISGFWWLMRSIADEPHLETQFLVAHAITRAATLFALSVLLMALEVPRWGIYAGTAMLATTPMLLGYSDVGKHDLFTRSLSHSDVAWPFLILALVFAIRRSWVVAAALAATVFSINAFIGIWLAIALASLGATKDYRPSLRSMTKATVVFLVLSAPVAAWIATALHGRAIPLAPFSFRDYVRAYFPWHFLIDAADPIDVAQTGALWLGALVAATVHGWRAWRLLLAAFAAIFVAGCVAPYLADNRIVFNLHLLRVDAVADLLSVTLLLAAAVLDLADAHAAAGRKLAGTALLGGIAVGAVVPAVLLLLGNIPQARQPLTRRVTLLALTVLLALCFWRPAFWGDRSPAIFGVAMLCASILLYEEISARRSPLAGTLVSLAVLTGALLAGRYRLQLGRMAVVSFPMMFLVGAVLVRDRATPRDTTGTPERVSSRPVAALGCILLAALMCVSQFIGRPVADAGNATGRAWAAVLQWAADQYRLGHAVAGPVLVPIGICGLSGRRSLVLSAHVPVWVDWKQGAAVMWDPGFYSVWYPRYERARRLTTSSEIGAYAVENGIPTLVLCTDADAGPQPCPLGYGDAFRNTRFAVCGRIDDSAPKIR